MLNDDDDDDKGVVCSYLAERSGGSPAQFEAAYDSVPRNVRTTLVRQVKNCKRRRHDRPVCNLDGEDGFITALCSSLAAERSIFTLARLFEEVHVYLCRAIDRRRNGKAHNADFLRNPCVKLRVLTEALADVSVVEQQIYLESDPVHPEALRALWRPVPPMAFDNLPVLPSLADLLPGETHPSHEYAGIGGGGGSDVISASIMGLLLGQHGKNMDLLISTRTWAIGSQGKAGTQIGIKRVVRDHGGRVKNAQGRELPDTFRVEEKTRAEGRDLEAIPLKKHSQIYMVLDQSESRSDIDDRHHVTLPEQFQAILSQSRDQIQTVMTIDTGGDVFGIDTDCGTTATPDQDFRVQQAILTKLPHYSSTYQLVTCVVAPGVDAPSFAPHMAERAGGMVYHPSRAEKRFMLDTLAKEYKMDGSDPTRFGKTILALQARLAGRSGWVSLDLPEYVVDTWENPWNSFVYVRECIEDVVLVPTRALVEELTTRLARHGAEEE